MKTKYYNINMKLIDGVFMNLNFDDIVKSDSDSDTLHFYKNGTIVFSSDAKLIKHKLKFVRARDLKNTVFKDYKLYK